MKVELIEKPRTVIGGIEEPITFTSLEALYDAFQADMERMLE